MPRLSVSLDSDVLQALATRANVERRSASSMAALLIEGALTEGGKLQRGGASSVEGRSGQAHEAPTPAEAPDAAPPSASVPSIEDLLEAGRRNRDKERPPNVDEDGVIHDFSSGPFEEAP